MSDPQPSRTEQTPEQAPEQAAPTHPHPRFAGFWAGRSGFVIPLLLAGFCSYLLYGVLAMDVPSGVDFPGPQAFPLILIVVGYLISALLVVHYLRTRDHPGQDGGSDADWFTRHRMYSDWRAVAWAAGGFAAFAVLLNPLGWILAATLLFWCVARGIGSTKPVFDVGVALVFSSAVYLGFSVGLGLHLPSGLLGGGI